LCGWGYFGQPDLTPELWRSGGRQRLDRGYIDSDIRDALYFAGCGSARD